MSYLKQKPGSIEEIINKLSSKVLESDYQDKFKKELEKSGKGIGAMTPKEKKAFFNKIDKMHTAKNENLEETHMGQTAKANQSQKDAKGEKEIIKPLSMKETIQKMWQEAAEKKDEKKVLKRQEAITKAKQPATKLNPEVIRLEKSPWYLSELLLFKTVQPNPNPL